MKVRKRKINLNAVKDVKQIKSTQSGRVEIELRQQCRQYGVRYIDREKDESRNKCMKRRKLMREQNAHVFPKNNKIMESNGDSGKSQGILLRKFCGNPVLVYIFVLVDAVFTCIKIDNRQLDPPAHSNLHFATFDAQKHQGTSDDMNPSPKSGVLRKSHGKVR